MKIKFLALIMMLVIVCIAAFPFGNSPVEVTAIPNEDIAADNSGYDKNEALKVKFEAMLNRNFSYDEDIADLDILINNSVLALLNRRTVQNESFIDENLVIDFVYDMYGIEIVDLSNLNANFPKKDGFVYIIPRGYSVYSHEVISINENEDGSFSVTTKVEVEDHDNPETELIATTLFIENEKSAFGYNIINSKIVENAITI